LRIFIDEHNYCTSQCNALFHTINNHPEAKTEYEVNHSKSMLKAIKNYIHIRNDAMCLIAFANNINDTF